MQYQELIDQKVHELYWKEDVKAILFLINYLNMGDKK